MTKITKMKDVLKLVTKIESTNFTGVKQEQQPQVAAAAPMQVVVAPANPVALPQEVPSFMLALQSF